MEKARNPTADQRRHFPGLQRGRNSRAGGCKPLSQQVCARHLCSFGQASILLLSALPLSSGATSLCAPCQSHCWGMSPPPVVCWGTRGDMSLWLLSPGLWRGAQPPRSSFDPGPCSSRSQDNDLQGEPGRGRKGEMQREPCRRANGIF